MTHLVVVYTQPNCVFCDRVKAYLRGQGVPFVEKDVVEDPHAMDELMDLGYAVTPLILVDGEPVVGFDRTKLEKLLRT